VFVNVVAFSESAQAALLALGDGDAVALAGTLTPKAWVDREGQARPALDMVAAQVLTAYQVKRKREAAAAGAKHQQPEPGRQPPTGDEFGDGPDPWLDGGNA
jgi:single-stranded DNA-binding protein